MEFSYGRTNTAHAVELARHVMFKPERGDRPEARNILVVLTDGFNNLNVQRTLEQARMARDDDIAIIPVGIGAADKDELKAMAFELDTASFFADEFGQLGQINEPVLDALLEGEYIFFQIPIYLPCEMRLAIPE